MRRVLHFANRILGPNKFKYGYLPAILIIATSGLIFEQTVDNEVFSIFYFLTGVPTISSPPRTGFSTSFASFPSTNASK